MSLLKRNVVANLLGRGWAAFMALALVPLFIQLLGVEAYGLIGFFATLQTVSALFDAGLSTTLNRELAALSAQAGSEREMRDLVRTLEAVYWAIACLVGVALVLASGPLATSWLRAEHLSAQSMATAVALMGVTIAFQFPFSLYSGGLLGLQRQALVNVITAVAATARFLGALGVLVLFGATIQNYFLWQIVVSVLQTLACAVALARSLPAGPAARPRTALLARVWRFAAGMAGIAVVSLLLTQLDKLLLSRLLTLREFGYYTLANVVASGLFVLINPFFTAAFPQLTQLAEARDEAALAMLYHRSCQVLTVLVMPVALTLALFSREILGLWTRSPELVENAHLLLSLLAIGTALNGLMYIPYALQLAYGWTKLALYQNTISVIALVPLIVWSANAYGAVGVAVVWIVLNAGYVSLGIQAMHTRLLPAEKLRWYRDDVAVPLASALLAALVGRALMPSGLPAIAQALYLALVTALTALGAAWSTEATNSWMRRRLLILQSRWQRP